MVKSDLLPQKRTMAELGLLIAIVAGAVFTQSMQAGLVALVALSGLFAAAAWNHRRIALRHGVPLDRVWAHEQMRVFDLDAPMASASRLARDAIWSLPGARVQRSSGEDVVTAIVSRRMRSSISRITIQIEPHDDCARLTATCRPLFFVVFDWGSSWRYLEALEGALRERRPDLRPLAEDAGVVPGK